MLTKLFFFFIECINKNLLFHRKYNNYVYNQQTLSSSFVFSYVRVDK